MQLGASPANGLTAFPARWIPAPSPWGGVDWGYGGAQARVRPVLAPEELEAERGLCERARGGDRAALGTLLERHGPRLYRAVLLPRLGNRALAEEALSLTYLRVVERIAKFEWQSVGIYPWLRVVALRIALDQIRSRK